MILCCYLQHLSICKWSCMFWGHILFTTVATGIATITRKFIREWKHVLLHKWANVRLQYLFSPLQNSTVKCTIWLKSPQISLNYRWRSSKAKLCPFGTKTKKKCPEHLQLMSNSGWFQAVADNHPGFLEATDCSLRVCKIQAETGDVLDTSQLLLSDTNHFRTPPFEI